MKTLKHLLTALILVTSIKNYSQKKLHLSEAVNIAGKQRMLCQRMAKAKVYIKASKKTKLADQELEKSMIAFQNGIEILREFAPDDNIKYKIDMQEFTFKTFKKQLTKNNKKALREVIATNTLFLQQCDDVVTSIINYSKTQTNNNDRNEKYVLENIAKATGASGKLRYLTQRLTLYYAINAYEFDKVTSDQIDEIVRTMERNLNYLTVLEFNTLEIDDSLSEVLYYWNELKKSLYRDGKIDLNSKKVQPEELFDLCNTILNKANTTTKMYADLNKS
ncbi:type IV pili methyl-accepting chemotaxis transducer N-terminal domain-containing protein [Wenyingzhuangia sp. IMCC45533]